MKRLLDIAPDGATKNSVAVSGGEVEISKLSAKKITGILARFPVVGQLLDGKKPETSKLVEIGADAVAAVIAAGCGYVGDEMERAEAFASELPIEDQLKLVEAIARLSLPKVVGPLIIDQARGAVESFVTSLQNPVEASPSGETQPTA